MSYTVVVNILHIIFTIFWIIFFRTSSQRKTCTFVSYLISIAHFPKSHQNSVFLRTPNVIPMLKLVLFWWLSDRVRLFKIRLFQVTQNIMAISVSLRSVFMSLFQKLHMHIHPFKTSVFRKQTLYKVHWEVIHTACHLIMSTISLTQYRLCRKKCSLSTILYE